jgi:hypothetical protein
MKTHLKLMASAAGIAALLASPVMARTAHHHHATATHENSHDYIPSDARGAAVPYGVPEGGPYAPDAPSPRHYNNPDFQDGSRG